MTVQGGKKKKAYTKTSTVKVKKTSANSSVMTHAEYSEVKAIVGGPGKLESSYEYSYDNFVCNDDDTDCWTGPVTDVNTDYSWKTTTKYGTASLDFENDQVTSKFWIQPGVGDLQRTAVV